MRLAAEPFTVVDAKGLRVRGRGGKIGEIFGRRELLKGELSRGEHKSITSDRVILVPGPAEEIAIVNELYRRFVREGASESGLASLLNQRGRRANGFAAGHGVVPAAGLFRQRVS